MARKLQVFLMFTLVTLVVASVAHAQGRRFRGGTTLISVAANEAVQKDAGIATDQADKISKLNDEFRDARRALREDMDIDFAELRDLPEEEQREVQQEIQDANVKLEAEYEPKLVALISKEQLARVKQIYVQASGLGSQAVCKELGVTDQQQEELTSIQQEFRTKRREAREGGGNREAYAKLRNEQEEASVKILTADQNTKYVAMKGKMFDVAQLRRRR